MCQNPKRQLKQRKRNRSIESQLGTAVPEQVYDDLLHAIRREALK